MSISVKKSVLERFIKNIVESRSDGNSYADMTGTMFDIDYDAEPIKAKSFMATQFTEEAPDVSDPEYIPGTKGELGRATSLIAKEVPDSQIEYFYRKIHKLLDNVIDRHEDKNMSEELYESLKRLLESDPGDDEFGDAGDAADEFLKQHGITDHNVDDDVTDDFGGGSSEPIAMTMGDAIAQAKKLRNLKLYKNNYDLRE